MHISSFHTQVPFFLLLFLRVLVSVPFNCVCLLVVFSVFFGSGIYSGDFVSVVAFFVFANTQIEYNVSEKTITPKTNTTAGFFELTPNETLATHTSLSLSFSHFRFFFFLFAFSFVGRRVHTKCVKKSHQILGCEPKRLSIQNY